MMATSNDPPRDADVVGATYQVRTTTIQTPPLTNKGLQQPLASMLTATTTTTIAVVTIALNPITYSV